MAEKSGVKIATKFDGKIKCLIFDLDQTLWQGTLVENDDVSLKAGMREIIIELDRRGILLSVASKNDEAAALKKLAELGLKDYFLYPQIGWNSKAESVQAIAKALNIGLDSLAFLDDQAFEREEIAFTYPEVFVIDSADYQKLLDMEAFRPRFVTEDSRLRRLMYQSDLVRKEAEQEFSGSAEEFLATLHMKLTVAPVGDGDLERVEELTVRTNQLNSTGTVYDYDTLRGFSRSADHIFLIASLEDKFGAYGKIGLLLLEETQEALIIRLLLMSCRVMTRGIGASLLVHAIKLAQEKGKKLRAEFVETGKNRVMYITYKMMGFAEIEERGDWSMLEYEGQEQREYPYYLEFDMRNVNEVNSTNSAGAKDEKGARDAKNAKNTRDAKDAKNAKNARDARDTKDAKDASEISEVIR